MEPRCAATNTISFKAFTGRGHVLFAKTCVSNHHDSQWFFPRVLFRGRFHVGQRLINEPTAAALIALFTKIPLLPVEAGVSTAISSLRRRHGWRYSYFSSSFTSPKAFTANSRSSREWAAETCVRTRAVPWGTTG